MEAQTDIVTATVTSLGRDVDENGWEHNAYRVTLHYQGRRMTVPYKTGTGWDREPTAADVLECVLSDASSYDNNGDDNFEDWAAEYGYDLDSRKAERLYRAVGAQTRKLRKLLGDAYESAVFPDGDDDNETVTARLTGYRCRLEELRAELRAERISYGELAELQSLAAFIEPGDVELLEAAGMPEHA